MFLLVGGDSEIGAAHSLSLKAAGRIAAATTRRPQLAGPDRPLLDLAADLSSWAPAPDISAACIFAATARLAGCAARQGRFSPHNGSPDTDLGGAVDGAEHLRPLSLQQPGVRRQRPPRARRCAD